MTDVKSAVEWALKYGITGFGLRTAARGGDLVARAAVEPALRADPFPAYDEVRAMGKVVPGRFVYATASYASCNEALRGDMFAVGPAPAPTKLLEQLLTRMIEPMSAGPVDPPSLLAIGPPLHTRIRKLVSHAFTARAINALSDRVQALAHELLDKIEANKPTRFDLMESYAAQLPVNVIADILGVPQEVRGRFLHMVHDAAMSLEPGLRWRDFKRSKAAIADAHLWFADHIARLRRNPGDDLLSRMIQAQEGKDQLSDLELRAAALLILGAGFETTVNLIGNGVALLLAHPDQLDRLKAEPKGWGNAVDEILRYDSPVQVTLRLPKADSELSGVKVPERRPILLMLGGANRDPEKFPNPHRFDTTRDNAREHLAFSAGPHFCLGAQLARMEGTTALQALFERFPDLSMDGRPVRRNARVLRGYDRLPLKA